MGAITNKRSAGTGVPRATPKDGFQTRHIVLHAYFRAYQKAKTSGYLTSNHGYEQRDTAHIPYIGRVIHTAGHRSEAQHIAC